MLINKIKKVIIFGVFLLAWTALVAMGLFCFTGQKALKNLRIEYLALKYESLMHKVASESYQTKRYSAMVDALKQGKLEYQFETGPLPTAK